VAVGTLALGIGANAAMFAVVNAVVFRPLPFPEAGRLVRVTADMVGLGSQDIGLSAPELYAYRDRSDLFEEIYRPLTQASTLSMGLVVRTSGDPSSVALPLSRSVRAVDPDQPTFAVRPMAEVQSAGTASRRFAIRLLGSFAVLALLLAAIGICGVLAYLVGQRTREIGIRIALGARRREVVGMVVGRAFVLAVKGVVIGGLASLVMGQLVADMLFQVRPYDPWTFATVAVLLTLTAVAASATPAARAAHVNPIAALRAD
jgi:ABC-type antimicrobial peptide transport system permease subunit